MRAIWTITQRTHCVLICDSGSLSPEKTSERMRSLVCDVVRGAWSKYHESSQSTSGDCSVSASYRQLWSISLECIEANGPVFLYVTFQRQCSCLSRDNRSACCINGDGSEGESSICADSSHVSVYVCQSTSLFTPVNDIRAQIVNNSPPRQVSCSSDASAACRCALSADSVASSAQSSWSSMLS